MEWIMELVGLLSENWPVLLSGIGFFSLLATVTPNKTDDEIMGWVLKAVNFLGANLGKATNAPDK